MVANDENELMASLDVSENLSSLRSAKKTIRSLRISRRVFNLCSTRPPETWQLITNFTPRFERGGRKILGEGESLDWTHRMNRTRKREKKREREEGEERYETWNRETVEVRCRWDESLNWAALTNDSNGSWPQKPWGTSHIARAHASSSLSVVPPSLFLLFSFRYSRLRTRPRMTRSFRIKNSIKRTNSDSKLSLLPFKVHFFFFFVCMCVAFVILWTFLWRAFDSRNWWAIICGCCRCICIYIFYFLN